MASVIIETLVKGIHSLAEAIAKADRGDQEDDAAATATVTQIVLNSVMRSPTETPTETAIELEQLKALKSEFLKGFQARGYRYRSIESLAEETGIDTEIVKSFVTNDGAFRRSTGSKSVFTMRQFD